MTSAIYIWSIVSGTLLFGSANSLFTKYQDNQCVRDCDTSHPRNFEQPALQTLQMFVGEFSLIIIYWLVYTRKGNTDPHGSLTILDNIKLAVPAACDLMGTTLLNVGLVYTPVSIYQMTRGSLVLFVAALSVFFLKKRVTKLEWISLSVITFGIGLVGLAGSSVGPGEGLSTLVLLGIAFIIFAEIVQSFQFVFEERVLNDHPIVPMQMVYCEGFYGMSILVVVMVVLNFLLMMVLSSEKFATSPFNIGESVSEMFNNEKVLLSSICIMISIAGFNYCGISLTSEISATTRSTVDTCRTLLVWFCALFMGWESFKFMQLVGFILLVFGTLCYNGVLRPEEWSWVPTWLKDEEQYHPLILDDRELL